MRVLGIDPGSHKTGWGVIQSEGGRHKVLTYGVICTKADTTATRLCDIANGIDEVVHTNKPEAIAIETIFHAKNAKSALILGQSRGVALLCAARAGVAIFEYTAGQIKQAVTGHGRAEKEQVQKMVQFILGINRPMVLDTSDALAAAICHAQMRVTEQSTFLAELAASRRISKQRLKRYSNHMDDI
ncbi:MAG: crossover junction endodeoxyribonuclease RuvC [Deltaproteobacteria bacterium]|nr:crossover junction endodeoxyribonuclease RuvC [Deltaproteobacteria bacterium]